MESLSIHQESTLENWISFWLAMHDLGKFSEAFQSQKPDLFIELRGRPYNPARSYRVRHDSLGMLYWRDSLSATAQDENWFGPQTDLALHGLNYWMRSVTGHHGQPPMTLGGEHWHQHFDRKDDSAVIQSFVSEVRCLFLTDAAAAIPAAMTPEAFLQVSTELSWWMAGLAVLADWIGSSTEFFPYRCTPPDSGSLREYWQYANEQAAKALDASGVLPATTTATLAFSDLFPEIIEPSPLQKWATAVETDESPQLIMLEDVTGAGKTEAATMLAYRLMLNAGAEGFFVGLPTMATANSMYRRIARVYHKMFSTDASLVLTNSRRNLVEAFANSVIRPGSSDKDAQQADDSATARCTAWLADHNKGSLLSPVGVGTVDQALLAVLHSRHQSLRLLGLFRKALIVDEVHACDTYMQGVLENLLEFHAHAGGSAILLSATLPQRMKQALLTAFARGRNLRSPAVTAQNFPLATHWQSSKPQALCEAAISTREVMRRSVALRYVSTEEEVFATIDSALGVGKAVCWIRNTVGDALAAFETFRTRIPQNRLTLFHARFAFRDRLDIEERVMARFGPDSTAAQRSSQLLIATQVVEQSLDVDFDLVISDLAPIDRLIQRGGRLQRHLRDHHGNRLPDPETVDQRGDPCLWVLGPPWMDEPSATWFKATFPKASHVYPHHGQLWLTAKALQAGHFSMPDDARRLIEGVFGEKAALPEGLQFNAVRAEGKSYADASAAHQNTVKLSKGYLRSGIDWWDEARTPSRLGEATADVVLLRWEGGCMRTWVTGPHGCAYSTIRVATRLIALRRPEDDPKREAAIEQFLQSLPNQGRWIIPLVLSHTTRGWAGEAWGEAQKDGTTPLRKWLYDSTAGLVDLRTFDNALPSHGALNESTN